MNQTSCEIKCFRCGKWMKSLIHFGDSGSFFTSTLIGNKQKCSLCGEMTDCNKENMRFVEKIDGGFMTTLFQGEDALD